MQNDAYNKQREVRPLKAFEDTLCQVQHSSPRRELSLINVLQQVQCSFLCTPFFFFKLSFTLFFIDINILY